MELVTCIRSRLDKYVNFAVMIDNIFVSSGGRVIQQTVGIPMGTNCDPLLVDLFLYYYEADFIQKLLRKKIRS